MLFCECCGQFAHYFLVSISLWLEYTHEELWWDTESEYTIDESSHDLQMEETIEELLEVEVAHVHDLHVVVLQINLQLREVLLVLQVLFTVEIEHSRLISVLLEDSNEVSSLFLHNSQSPKLVSIWVCLIQELVAAWNNSWHVHLFDVHSELMLVFFLCNCCLLLLVINKGVGENELSCSLLPVLEVRAVEVDQE